ncbi:MAG TPA: hypothetical protein VF715_12365 [Thermoleophilaceae bacterium]|jgi:hypothetical protein
METSELTRAVVGVPVATVVPRFIAPVGDRFARIPATLVLALWALGPVLDDPRAWAIAGAAVLTGQALGSGGTLSRDVLVRASAGLLVMGVVTGALLDWGTSTDAVDAGVSEPDAVVVVGGLLVTVFLGGAAIEQLLAPYAVTARPSASQDLARAGLLIGWLERALLYGFVVGGAPGGVALVVAAKALARLPSLSKEDKFAEYFLIGTLASVLVAVGIGAIVRAVLGLGPLLP